MQPRRAAAPQENNHAASLAGLYAHIYSETHHRDAVGKLIGAFTGSPQRPAGHSPRHEAHTGIAPFQAGAGGSHHHIGRIDAGRGQDASTVTLPSATYESAFPSHHPLVSRTARIY